MSNPDGSNPVLDSLRLGWLVVEAYGRLRRWARSSRQPTLAPADPARRFSYSDRDLSLYDQLSVTLQQLKKASSALIPEVPSFFPEDQSELLAWARQDADRLWSEFENWSREIWICLQIKDPLAGRAYTTGGGLADTFWHAQAASEPAKELESLLRPQRLDSIADRLNGMSEHLPEGAARVIRFTLHHWRIAGRLQYMDETRQKRMLARLEAQAKVWYDLLFGLQQPEDYLRQDDRRLVAWGSVAATVILVILSGGLVWWIVLLSAWQGRLALAAISGVSFNPNTASGALAEKFIDWQNWSSLLAAASSVVVILTGVVKQLSGWMVTFHRWARTRLVRHRVNLRTYRSWKE